VNPFLGNDPLTTPCPFLGQQIAYLGKIQRSELKSDHWILRQAVIVGSVSCNSQGLEQVTVGKIEYALAGCHCFLSR
jgi:hypothetical protein